MTQDSPGLRCENLSLLSPPSKFKLHFFESGYRFLNLLCRVAGNVNKNIPFCLPTGNLGLFHFQNQLGQLIQATLLCFWILHCKSQSRRQFCDTFSKIFYDNFFSPKVWARVLSWLLPKVSLFLQQDWPPVTKEHHPWKSFFTGNFLITISHMQLGLWWGRRK